MLAAHYKTVMVSVAAGENQLQYYQFLKYFWFLQHEKISSQQFMFKTS